jgi:hypothetical protein
MLQKSAVGVSDSGSGKRPARKVVVFALVAMLASLVATDYPVIVSPAYAGGDQITAGVTQSAPYGKPGLGKQQIVSCKPGFNLVDTNPLFGSSSRCEAEEVQLNTKTPARESSNPASDTLPKGNVERALTPVEAGLGAGVAAGLFWILMNGNGTAGTTGTTGTR